MPIMLICSSFGGGPIVAQNATPIMMAAKTVAVICLRFIGFNSFGSKCFRFIGE